MAVATNPLISKTALKRKSFSLTQPTPCSVSFAPNKKLCLSPSISRRNSAAALYSCSSSSEDDDSETEAGYLNNQRRAKKRAFFNLKRSSSFADDKLSNAVSKYSDVEEDENEDQVEVESKVNKAEIIKGGELKSLSNPQDVSYDLESKSHRGSVSSTQRLFSDSRNVSKKSPLDHDLAARNRCFDYLVGAIDEAWARYCDATSYAEDEAYKNVEYLPNTPASLAMSEYEDDDDDADEQSEVDYITAKKAPSVSEYSSDVELKRVSSHPGNVRLQQLKDRLLKAKYYLQDYLDTTEAEDAITFWKRWDLVKYATIELVEDDDDDEIIESTSEDLEKGRLYGCF